MIIELYKKTNGNVGIFDTGAMALQSPTSQEQRMLGNIFRDATKSNHITSLNQFGKLLSDSIENIHGQNIDTRYLIEVQKGILALGDFLKVLSPLDIADIATAIDLPKTASSCIKLGAIEDMTSGDLRKLKNKFSIVSKNKASIRICKSINLSFNLIENIDTLPVRQRKAEWIETALKNSNDDEQDKPNSYIRKLRVCS